MHFQYIVYHTVLGNLAAADELPDKFIFSNSNSFVAIRSAGRSLGRRKDCLERYQSYDDDTSRGDRG